MRFPDHQPPVQGYHVANDGGLWLRREEDGGTHHRWLLLDPDGEPAGQVELPQGCGSSGVQAIFSG
jgi:sugar lactone lactonase YvrE